MIIGWGNCTYIKKLERKHVDEMQKWGDHKDPLFYCYSFPKMNKSEGDYWYKEKANSFTRRCYVVFNQEYKLVGYISLRNIKWFRRFSELGIVFDADNMNNGYGTDSLKSFLHYYFGKLRMKRLNLSVAEFNYRARKCYEKCGFVVEKIQYDNFEDQDIPIFQSEAFNDYRDYFKMEKGKLKCRFHHLFITKEMFEIYKGTCPYYPPNTCA